MYSYEQRTKAVELYIKLGKDAPLTMQKLGYPKSRNSLNQWFKEFESTKTLHKNRLSKPRITDKQKRAVIRYYLSHGRNAEATSRHFGSPCSRTLRNWLKKMAPKECKMKSCSDVQKFHKRFPKELKAQAVAEFISRKDSVKNIANKYGTTSFSLYKWSKEFLPKEDKELNSMPQNNNINQQDLKNLEELLSTVESLRNESLRLEEKVKALREESKRFDKLARKSKLEFDVYSKAAEIIKKGKGVNLEELSNKEKAEVIDALKCQYAQGDLLSALSISKSSYYYAMESLENEDKYKDLRAEVIKVFHEAYDSYGYRRIRLCVQKENGQYYSEKVIRQIMQEEGLLVASKKKRKYSSYIGEVSPAVCNIINRDFHADAPNEKWLTDITEFHIPAGKVYLSPIIDCFDGAPVAWSIGTSPNAELANSMLEKAVATLKENEHPIVHSDRGCHYRWPGWINIMNREKLVRSMSKKGCSPDNSACEGFFGHLKTEMFYNRDWQGVSIEEFIVFLDKYLRWFRSSRVKISLNGLSPEQYREASLQAP